MPINNIIKEENKTRSLFLNLSLNSLQIHKLKINNSSPKTKNQKADISCNAAMVLAKSNNTSPIKIAELIKKNLILNFKEFKDIEIAGPGFLNISFEYRIKNGYFIPQFFDGSYDLSRVTVQTTESGIIVRTKDQLVFADPLSNKDTSDAQYKN